MRQFISAAALLVSIVAPLSASARQAEILTFSSELANEASSREMTVLDAMQGAASIAKREATQLPVGTISRFGEGGVSTNATPPNPKFGSQSSCERGEYARTWWLTPAVEARREAYYPAMARVACEFGISVDLLDAVITQESGYNSFALSGAGAMGMMQIMPGTARNLGLFAPWDALANMRSGARYLRAQLDRFGSVPLALAAYNAGPERRSLALGRLPAIPETLGYVRAITTNWARLVAYHPVGSAAAARTVAASAAVRAAGYRDISLTIYEGINASKPI